MLFHGPCKEVMPFFQGLGFDIPERKGIPDFLQEVSGLRDQEVRVAHDLYLTPVWVHVAELQCQEGRLCLLAGLSAACTPAAGVGCNILASRLSCCTGSCLPEAAWMCAGARLGKGCVMIVRLPGQVS